MFHSTKFEENETHAWRLRKKLLVSEEGLAQFPWEYDEFPQRTRTISSWICDVEHFALSSLIESTKTLFGKAEVDFLLDIAVTKLDLRLLDFLLCKCLISQRPLNEILRRGAKKGHRDVIARLLIADADVNADVSVKG